MGAGIPGAPPPPPKVAATGIEVTAEPADPGPGVSTSVVVAVSGSNGIDKYGVKDVAVTLQLVESPDRDASLTPLTGTTDVGGTLTVKLTTSKRRGRHVISATAGSLNTKFVLDTLTPAGRVPTRARHLDQAVTIPPQFRAENFWPFLGVAVLVLFLGFAAPYRGRIFRRRGRTPIPGGRPVPVPAPLAERPPPRRRETPRPTRPVLQPELAGGPVAAVAIEPRLDAAVGTIWMPGGAPVASGLVGLSEPAAPTTNADVKEAVLPRTRKPRPARKAPQPVVSAVGSPATAAILAAAPATERTEDAPVSAPAAEPVADVAVAAPILEPSPTPVPKLEAKPVATPALEVDGEAKPVAMPALEVEGLSTPAVEVGGEAKPVVPAAESEVEATPAAEVEGVAPIAEAPPASARARSRMRSTTPRQLAPEEAPAVDTAVAPEAVPPVEVAVEPEAVPAVEVAVESKAPAPTEPAEAESKPAAEPAAAPVAKPAAETAAKPVAKPARKRVRTKGPASREADSLARAIMTLRGIKPPPRRRR